MKKHGGLREILKTGQAPGVLVRGDRKGKAFTDVAPQHQVVDTGGGLKDGKPIPAGKATMRGIGKVRARAREEAHQQNLEAKRSAIRMQGGQKSKDWKLTHSIPAELYYAKIQESKDQNFWNDPKNRDASGGKMPA